MTTIAAGIWDLAASDDDDPSNIMRASRSIWDTHGYSATWFANALATSAASRIPGISTTGVQPPTPRPLALSMMGSDARAMEIAHATWNLVAGIGRSQVMGVADPFLERELRRISTAFKGSGVYMFSIWSRWALGEIERSATDDYPRVCDDLRAGLDEMWNTYYGEPSAT